MKTRTLAVTVVAATLALGCASAPSPKAPNLNPAPATTAKAEPGVGEGSWEVGTDVKAGTYTTTVPADERCYWARLKNFDGELGSIIANDNLAAGARGRLVVKPTDKGLELTGPCRWLPVKAKGAAK